MKQTVLTDPYFCGVLLTVSAFSQFLPCFSGFERLKVFRFHFCSILICEYKAL